MFQNKSRYSVLVINTTNQHESEKFQSLSHRYGIHWKGYAPNFIFDFGGNSRYIYLILNNKRGDDPRMLYSGNLDLGFLDNHSWNKKIYRIENYNEVLEFLKYDGLQIPNYRPRKVDRTL